MIFYNRNIFNDLKTHLQKRQITVLTGMRSFAILTEAAKK